MAPTTSTATWITASIHIMATVVHFRDVETKPSITSAETRCVMGTATQAAEVIARNSVKLKEHRCHLAGRPQRANHSATGFSAKTRTVARSLFLICDYGV